MKPELFIFDLDGTLYQFDKGESKDFGSSQFYANIKKNAYSFFSKRLGITLEEAELGFNRIKLKYDGEISLGVETEYGINRYEYFKNTWNLNPADYFPKNPSLPVLFSSLESRVAILTAAPRIWAIRALKYLDIFDFVKDSLFTGEPTIRKPNPLAFRSISDYFKIDPSYCVSIGDQEQTDIIPAKSLGMKTVIVGKSSFYADFEINYIGEFLNLSELEKWKK